MLITRWRLGLLLLALASMVIEAKAGPTKVSGRVVLADGKPAIGVDVASTWSHSGGKLNAFEGVKTDADGRFTLPVETNGRPFTLMAADPEGKLGGLAVVKPGDASKPVEIKLGPLVHVFGECISKDPAVPILMAWVSVTIAGETTTPSFMDSPPDEPDIKIGQPVPEKPATFELRLPVGDYVLQCYEPKEPTGHKARFVPLTIKLDRPDNIYKMPRIELELSALVKLYGQEPPPLKIKDARGVPKGVKLADFKGKYVLLEFWATWCGPCLGQGIPDLMELYDEHEADRDKFVILAVHTKGSDDFADLDKKLAPIVRDTWHGRNLPFPILLDDDGQTSEAYGIEGIPASVLIDPQGKVVEGGAEALREALPEVPLARRLPRALDRQFAISIGSEGAPMGVILEMVCGQARIEVKPDVPAMARARVKFADNVPLTITGQVSLRSWLDLVLSPMGLVAVPGPDGLIVTTPDPLKSDDALSAPQLRCAERIGRKLEAKTRFDFKNVTLAELAKHFEEETTENFVLDPSDRLAGRLDPEAIVTGKGEDIPLKDVLKSLLAPIGIEAVIRDEVVVLTRIRP